MISRGSRLVLNMDICVGGEYNRLMRKCVINIGKRIFIFQKKKKKKPDLVWKNVIYKKKQWGGSEYFYLFYMKWYLDKHNESISFTWIKKEVTAKKDSTKI